MGIGIPRCVAGLLCACICVYAAAGDVVAAPGAQDAMDPDRFEVTPIVQGGVDVMQMTLTSEGRILYIERRGRVHLYDPQEMKSREVGRLEVGIFGEVGLVGIAVGPNFNENPWVYLLYCPMENPDVMRLSRFLLSDKSLSLDQEEMLLQYGIDKDFAVHMGGGLVMSASGDLYVGTGDNSIPIPELPVDQRPGNEHLDAMRSSGNSRDLRGAILRIHPEPEGGYSIPKGNLFEDGKEGRPEIYAMGCRNPFRISYDDESKTLFWGDVGPNISMDVPIGPNGYDEFNATQTAGNFGWPMFVGPNEPYRRYDFATGELGEPFDPDHPVNDSRNNTGTQQLPPARPAMIWYPSTPSDVFPELGTGGRSAMSGPVFRDRPTYDPVLKIPTRYDGALFVFDWTRNWIMAVWRDGTGAVSRIEPFMPHYHFRKPIHLVLADDGTLYLVEFGDKWYDNRDSRIVRITYRRGNRAPRPVVNVTRTVGKAPLATTLDASRTSDPDAGDTLRYKWLLDGNLLPEEKSAQLDLTLSERGSHTVTLEVTDSANATSSLDTTVSVGNARPTVTLHQPEHGSFFDWGELVKYRVSVEDEEDGTSTDREIADAGVVVKASYRQRLRALDDEEQLSPGLALMQQSTCFSCHATTTESGGPAYVSVAKKYVGNAAAKSRLAQKILAGGSGVWGEKAMPSHPNHTLEEADLMADWVLSLAWDRTRQVFGGHNGVVQLPEPPSHRGDAGVVVIEATYTDAGSGEIPPATGRADCVLHSPRKKPAFADILSGVSVVDVFEGEGDLVGFFDPDGYTVFEQVRLDRVRGVKFRAARLTDADAAVELRLDAVDGPMLASLSLTSDGSAKDTFAEVSVPVSPNGGVHDVFVVARASKKVPAPAVAVRWLYFELEPQTSSFAKVVLVPVTTRSPETSSQLRVWCNLLAKALNQLDQVQAVVSPDENWPEDHRIVANSRVIIFCQYHEEGTPIDSTPAELASNVALMKRLGVGVNFLHLSDEADVKQRGTFHAIVSREPFDGSSPPAPDNRLSKAMAWPPGQSESQPWLQVGSVEEGRAIGWLRAPTDAGRRIDVLAPSDPHLLLEPAFVVPLLRAAMWSGWREDILIDNLWLEPSWLPITPPPFVEEPSLITADHSRFVPGGYALPPAASSFASDVDQLLTFISVVGFVTAISVIVVGVTFCVRYRARPGHQAIASPSHNLALELAWSVFPALLLAVIFFRGFKGYMEMSFAPSNAYVIETTAKKWSWSFTYPNGHVDEELHLPAEQPVKLRLRSDDVIHSVYIPAFRVKMDCVPGRYTSVWFRANEPTPEGYSYPLFCAEYCGTQHSRMITRVVVHDPAEFESWLESAQAAIDNLSPVDAGKRLYMTRGCMQCHSVDGTNRPGGGPSFLGTFGTQQSMTTGIKLLVDENFIRDSILNPTANIRSGFRPLMPTYQGQLTDRDIDHLVAFIRSLGEEPEVSANEESMPAAEAPHP